MLARRLAGLVVRRIARVLVGGLAGRRKMVVAGRCGLSPARYASLGGRHGARHLDRSAAVGCSGEERRTARRTKVLTPHGGGQNRRPGCYGTPGGAPV